MERTSANFRAARETIGMSQLDVANALGVNLKTVKRWEQGRGWEPPEDAWRLVERQLGIREQVVDYAVGKALEQREAHGEPDVVTLSYFRDQRMYDEHGRDGGPFGVANANARAVAEELAIEGFEVEFVYPS